MNTRTRYLVLDSKNLPQRPCDHGLNLKGVQSDKSPSLLDPEVAKQFAALLAKKNKGNAFYVVQTTAAVEAFDILDSATAGDKGVEVAWAPTTAAE